MDQRGVSRPQGNACDIGAYESGDVGDVTPPGPVPSLTATLVTTDSITIEWGAATDDTGVAGYKVYVQADGSTQPPALAGETCDACLVFSVTGLAPDTLYRLWVVAYDAAGNAADLADLTPIQVTTLALTSPGSSQIRIDISPPVPTITDVVTITVSGVYTESCTPGYASHQVTGHEIAIQSAPSSETICSPVETPWSYDVAVGPLEAGLYTVTHTLETDVISKTFTVTEKAVPCAPKFEVDESQSRTAIEGHPFTYQVTAVGTQPIVYTLQQGPAGMTVDGDTGLVRWTPPAGAAGDAPVVVRATNSVGENDYAFTINVRTVVDMDHHNYLPVIQNN